MLISRIHHNSIISWNCRTIHCLIGIRCRCIITDKFHTKMYFNSAKAIVKHIMHILANKFQLIIHMRRNNIIYSINYFGIKDRLFVLIEFYLKL